jgi:hypothetical protein
MCICWLFLITNHQCRGMNHLKNTNSLIIWYDIWYNIFTHFHKFMLGEIAGYRTCHIKSINNNSANAIIYIQLLHRQSVTLCCHMSESRGYHWNSCKGSWRFFLMLKSSCSHWESGCGVLKSEVWRWWKVRMYSHGLQHRGVGSIYASYSEVPGLNLGLDTACRGCGCLWFSSVPLVHTNLVPPNRQHYFLPRPYQIIIH